MNFSMVNFSAVCGCGNRGDRDKKGFFCLPTVIKKNQGERTLQLSSFRRDKWLAALHREDLKPQKYPYYRVCSDLFLTGKDLLPNALVLAWHLDYNQLEPQVHIKLNKDCYKSLTVGKPAALYDETNPDWVPSLKIGYGTDKSSEIVEASVRYHRKCVREKRKAGEMDEQTENSTKIPRLHAQKGRCSCSIQTEMPPASDSALQTEVRLQLENHQQEKSIS